MNEDKELKDRLRKIDGKIMARMKEVSGASYNFGLVIMDGWANE